MRLFSYDKRYLTVYCWVPLSLCTNIEMTLSSMSQESAYRTMNYIWSLLLQN